MTLLCLTVSGIALGCAIVVILVGDRRAPAPGRRVEYVRRGIERPTPLRRESDKPKD